MTKGRWKKLCRPPTHGVSQYRFTAARVQWPCSTVTIKPIWSLKWSGQVCAESYGLEQFDRISSGMELWADNYAIFRNKLGPGISTRPKLHKPGKYELGQGTTPKVYWFVFHWWVPGTTRPRRLLTLWLLPEHQRVIGFSFQLAIIQHQFALHALGYCHLCKDTLPKFRRGPKGRRLEM